MKYSSAILHYMNISVRKAKPSDAKNIQEVFYQTWLETYPNAEIGITKGDIEKKFESSFSEESISGLTKKIENLSKTTLFLVAIDEDNNGKIIGLCRVFLLETYNQLQAIYVLPAYQRKGVGLKLWEESKKYFQNEKDIIVQVAVYNEQAISFYRKLGFIDTGKRFEDERFKMPISGVVIPEMELVIKK